MAITPKRFTLVLTFIAIVGVSCLLLSAQQKSVSVEGYVLDSACAFTKNLDKPISRECALSCAKGRVAAKGKLYDRGGSHALVIEQIAAAPTKK